MKKRPVSLLSSPWPLGAHQQLAAAVIRQALIDAADPAASERLRANARAFLDGSSMLRQWCLVAGLELGCVEREYEAHRAQAPSQAVAPALGPQRTGARSMNVPRRGIGRAAANVRQQSSGVGTLAVVSSDVSHRFREERA